MIDSGDLPDEAARFLREATIRNLTDTNGNRWVAIPGHTDSVIPAQKRKKGRLDRRLRSPGTAEFHEEATTLLVSFLLDRLRPKTFFDVGAWQGHFAFVAASHIAEIPAIHAFDMRPQGIEWINQRASELGLTSRLHGHLVGFSDRHLGPTRVWYARMRMFERQPEPHEYQESAWRRLKFFLRGNKERGLRAVDLQVTTLDRFCADHNAIPDFMKIDVDGYEGKILRGARELLSTAKPTVLLELHKDEVQRDGIYRVDVTDMLFDAGYSALFLTDHHRKDQCRLLKVGRGDAILARQKTDMVLFLPPHLT